MAKKKPPTEARQEFNPLKGVADLERAFYVVRWYVDNGAKTKAYMGFLKKLDAYLKANKKHPTVWLHVKMAELRLFFNWACFLTLLEQSFTDDLLERFDTIVDDLKPHYHKSRSLYGAALMAYECVYPDPRNPFPHRIREFGRVHRHLLLT
jgi:hypothetical protein